MGVYTINCPGCGVIFDWFSGSETQLCGACVVTSKSIPELATNNYPGIEALAKGKKFDQEKAPMDLLSFPALEELAKVLGMGKNKYGAYNWLEGVEYNRLIAAAFRHLHQFNNGENVDKESNLSHVAHAMCNLMFLLHFEKTGRIELDNRYKGKHGKQEDNRD